MKAWLKKFILSSAVIIVFIFYSIFQRQINKPAGQTGGPLNDTAGAGNINSGQLPVSPPNEPIASLPAQPLPAATPPAAKPPVRQTGLQASGLRDGSFVGALADAYYGQVQVKAIVSGGKLTDVQLLSSPRENQTSILINNQALPLLKSEAIRSQSDKINVITGATYTSNAYITSLSSALAKSQNKAQPITPLALKPPVAPPVPTPPTATINPAPTNATTGYYIDGQYTGPVADAYYGQVQVKAVIQGSKLTDVQFLNYPQDRQTSAIINSQAMPILTSEAIQAQSAQVNIVSGATHTSYAFIESLASALNQALAPGQTPPASALTPSAALPIFPFRDRNREEDN